MRREIATLVVLAGLCTGLALTFSGCNKAKSPTDPPKLVTYHVKGYAYDPASHRGLANVQIDWQNPDDLTRGEAVTDLKGSTPVTQMSSQTIPTTFNVTASPTLGTCYSRTTLVMPGVQQTDPDTGKAILYFEVPLVSDCGPGATK